MKKWDYALLTANGITLTANGIPFTQEVTLVCDQNGDEYKYFNENNDPHQWALLCFSVRKLYFVIVILFVADLMLFYMHLYVFEVW